ncbi:MAG: DUF6876 family protein [Taibaiella sp.]|jgi:hypothetical protein
MNANDQLADYTCTENYYTHFTGILFTDGVRALCETFECYWFLDIICSYQRQLRNEEFQSWKLMRAKGTSAIVTCDNGNGRILIEQLIPFTDFEPSGATVWLENNVALLPSER